jgi:hypothetical protein
MTPRIAEQFENYGRARGNCPLHFDAFSFHRFILPGRNCLFQSRQFARNNLF